MNKIISKDHAGIIARLFNCLVQKEQVTLHAIFDRVLLHFPEYRQANKIDLLPEIADIVRDPNNYAKNGIQNCADCTKLYDDLTSVQ